MKLLIDKLWRSPAPSQSFVGGVGLSAAIFFAHHPQSRPPATPRAPAAKKDFRYYP
ncbi:MAG: hypothetical protein LBQ31_06775 [Bacteroidales bacterium]|nr:hypothetical protein [Bacteroidales bacterium]